MEPLSRTLRLPPVAKADYRPPRGAMKVSWRGGLSTCIERSGGHVRRMGRWGRILALLVVLTAGSHSATHGRETVPLQVETAQGVRSFNVELALSREEQRQGLMHRRHLDEDAGMLFIFPATQRLGFWMRNTLIPLDMLFIDDRGRIFHIHENAEPLSEVPIVAPQPGRAVLEIGGGLSRKLGIDVGDRVLHPVFQ